MTTDDTGPGDPSGLPVSGNGEQLLCQPQDSKPELDAYGLPVQHQPAKGRTVLGEICWLIAIACPILGCLSAGIGATYSVSHHKLASHLAGLGTVAGWLVVILVAFALPLWWGQVEKREPGKAILNIVVVGMALGGIGLCMLIGIPNAIPGP